MPRLADNAIGSDCLADPGRELHYAVMQTGPTMMADGAGRCTLLAMLVLAAGASCRTVLVEPPPSGTDMVLVLSHALPEGESLFVYMHTRDGAARRAFSIAPDFNPMPHETRCDALMVADTEIRGPILVKFTPDAWVPGTNDADSLECVFELNIMENTVTGRYSYIRDGDEHVGDVVGSTIRACSIADATAIDLHMENARPEKDASLTDANAWHRRGLAQVRLLNGRQKGSARLVNDHHVYGWSAPARSLRLTPDPPALTATMTAAVDGDRFDYALTGLHIADKVAGRFRVSRAGDDVCEGAFIGTLDIGRPPPPELELHPDPDGPPHDVPTGREVRP